MKWRIAGAAVAIVLASMLGLGAACGDDDDDDCAQADDTQDDDTTDDDDDDCGGAPIGIDSVEPGEGAASAAHALAITGGPFRDRVTVALIAESGAARVLAPLVRIDETLVVAPVPAGIDPGVYAVRVTVGRHMATWKGGYVALAAR